MPTFPLIHQPDAMDCGPACLAMIAKHYGKEYNIDNLRNIHKSVYYKSSKQKHTFVYCVQKTEDVILHQQKNRINEPSIL